MDRLSKNYLSPGDGDGNLKLAIFFLKDDIAARDFLKVNRAGDHFSLPHDEKLPLSGQKGLVLAGAFVEKTNIPELT